MKYMYTIEMVNIMRLLAGVQQAHVWLVQPIEFMLQYLYKTNDLIRILSALPLSPPRLCG